MFLGGNNNICKEPQPWIGMHADGKKPKKTSKLVWVNTEDAKIIALLRASWQISKSQKIFT